jgi:probable HAF family extracellular repeat protein
MKKFIISTLAVAVSLLTLPAAQSSPFTFTSLPFIANGINNAGQIVGIGVSGESTYGLLYQGGVLTPLFVPGAMDTIAAGINNGGDIAGSYSDRTLALYGFVYAHGTFTTLPLAYSARAINDSGQVAGYALSPSGAVGFFYNGAAYVTIAVPGARSTEALGIDNAGDVIGTYTDSSGRRHGFLYDSQGVLTTIDVPGSAETFVNGINNLGMIVRTYQDTSSSTSAHGFIDEGGVFTTVDAPAGITLEH